jgi:hypothetical protein
VSFLVVRRLADDGDLRLRQLRREDGEGAGGVALATEPLGEVGGVLPRPGGGDQRDLAHAHRVGGSVNDAQRQARAARLHANRTGSVRHLRRIDRLALSE